MFNFNSFKQFYNFSEDFSFEDLLVLTKETEIISLKKRNIFIEQGSTENSIYYIESGIVRSFYIDNLGKETTFKLYSEHDIIADENVILFDLPSKFYYETLEPSTIYQIDYDVINSIASQKIKLELNRQFILQKLIVESNKRIESFILLTSEERYIRFIKDHPELSNRVQDKYIANVLGLTPVSLSRIRRRIANRE